MATVDYELVTVIDEANPVEGDLRVVGRKLSLIRGGDAVAQECNVVVKWWLAEWFLDTSRGVPYREQLFRGDVDEVVVDRVLRASAFDFVPDLAPHPVLKVSIDTAARIGTVNVTGRTLDGAAIELDTTIGGA
jgi:hypothetical protein